MFFILSKTLGALVVPSNLALILIAVLVVIEVIVDRAQRRPRSGIATTNENES